MRQFLVEQFGYVKAEQTSDLNAHLGYALEAFDAEYKRAGGVIGSPNHEQDREFFARDVSTCLVDMFRNDAGLPVSISTETELTSASLGKRIKIQTKTDYTRIDRFQDGHSGLLFEQH